MTHLEAIRSAELDIILRDLKRDHLERPEVLEIGGGSGWQAKKLAENGYSVQVIDLSGSLYSGERIWPILDYDGKRIPFPNECFDIVFSSSVLEHIPHVFEFQSEIRRVLRPGGIAIHVVPSASWRFWTTAVHYLFITKAIVKIIYNKILGPRSGGDYNEVENHALVQMGRLSKTEIIKKAIFPPRHGEVGTALTELYYFSRYRWLRLFRNSNWDIKKQTTTHLFYTGHMIFGAALSMRFRKYLSCVFGSSSHIFLLAKHADDGQSGRRGFGKTHRTALNALALTCIDVNVPIAEAQVKKLLGSMRRASNPRDRNRERE